jgi:hypothetical protein
MLLRLLFCFIIDITNNSKMVAVISKEDRGCGIEAVMLVPSLQ